LTEKRQFLRIARKLCATFVAQIGNSAPYARGTAEPFWRAVEGVVVKSSKCKDQSANNAKPDTRERVILSEVESESQRDERGSRFGIQNSAPARKHDRVGWSPSCNATRVTEGVIGKNKGNVVKTFFSSLLIVFATLFAAPAFAALPAGYTELEYIKSSNNAFLDTGYILQSDNIKYEWEAIDAAGSTSSLFGSETSTNPKYSGILHGSPSSRALFVGSSASLAVGYTTDTTSFHSWVLDITSAGKASLYKDGTKTGTVNWTVPIQKSLSIYIFSNHSKAQYANNVSLKYFKITDNNELKVNLVPAQRDSDGKIGMYDLAGNRFITNTQGNLIAGPVQRDAQCSKHGMKYVSRSLIPNISDDYASYYYKETGRVMSYSNGVLSVTWPTSDTTSSGNNGITARNMDYIGGHVYASIGYVNSDGTFNLGAGGTNGLITGATDSIPATNGWQWACNRLVVTNNVYAHPNFRIMQKGKTLSISEIYLVDLTEMFGAGNEPATSEAIIAALVDNNCAAKIKIATTAYNSARFSPVVTDLNSAVATIREIVTNTINQTAAIASLQADKQTRPEDACPVGKKCLLVETEENGVIVPHWFPIIENIYGLPAGYTALEYIQSDGNSWIDTGIKGNMSYKYDIEFQQLDAGQYRNWGAFNQQTYDGGPNMSLTYASGFAVRWTVTGDAQQMVSEISSLDTNRHHLVIDNGYVTWDGVSKGRSTGHRDNYILSYNLFLGTINPGGTTPTSNAKSKYYSYKVWNTDGNLIQNFVPAKNSSGVIGMYDTVNDRFYTNAGTGSLTAGPEI